MLGLQAHGITASLGSRRLLCGGTVQVLQHIACVIMTLSHLPLFTERELRPRIDMSHFSKVLLVL